MNNDPNRGNIQNQAGGTNWDRPHHMGDVHARHFEYRSNGNISKDTIIFKAFIISLSKISSLTDKEITQLTKVSDQLTTAKLNKFALSYSPITRVYRKVVENLSDDLDSDEKPDEQTGELPNDVVEILKSPDPVRSAKKLCEKLKWSF